MPLPLSAADTLDKPSVARYEMVPATLTAEMLSPGRL